MTTKINGTNSAASPAITGTDTDTGLSFASDTVNINTGGTTRATIDSAGALDVPTNFPIKVNGSEKLRIDSTGKVGLNVSSPTELLTVGGCAEFKAFEDGNGQNGFHSTGFIIGNAFSAGKGSSVSDDRNIILWNERGLDIDFGTSNTQRMKINYNGDVLIGTTSLGNTNAYFQASSNSRNILHLGCGGTENSDVAKFLNPNGTVGTIRTNGSSTSFNTSSDYRLKENVVAISDGITRLKTLKPSRFNFKADTKTTVDGFLAHEVTAVPEAIHGTKDEVDSNNKPVYQGIDQSKLVPLLTAALQEAITKIETLETKVAALEAA